MRLSELVGPETLTISAVHTGWPAQADLRVGESTVPVDLFVGPIGSAHRPNRQNIERRFQNPGSGRSVTSTPGRLPLLVGVWEADPYVEVDRPVIALADPSIRAERTETRFSVFQHLPSLIEAMHTGWVEHVNSRDEIVRYLLPTLLPMAVSADIEKVTVPSSAVQAAVLGSGLADPGADISAAQRARRATTAIIRDARFSKQVIDAYGGYCAMCGLDSGLIEGAHIYPAAAVGSPDIPSNGIALCPTHHSAFDRHLVGIHPEDRSIHYNPKFIHQAPKNPAADSLISQTFPTLAEPKTDALRPSTIMFNKRYEHFAGQYAWMVS
jgi:hypothetical protein